MVESGDYFGTSNFSDTDIKVKTLIILNAEGALNYVEITVKLDFLPYKFDLTDSLMETTNHQTGNNETLISVFFR